MTWFLFGSSAIPMLLAVIQRTGVKGYSQNSKVSTMARADAKEMFAYVTTTVDLFKKDMNWVQEKGDYISSSFIIPPLQVVAACINFCTLLISGKHLFQLPFRSYQEILDARELINSIRKNVR